ncbi:MAG: histone deacetylase family protein, partial [Devosiaceae bacterium]|nr:histone deacetylase family protein [Devosiaceae bacterium]
MTTMLVSQPKTASHITPPGHPERPERLTAVANALSQPQFNKLNRETARTADLSLGTLVHDKSVLNSIQMARPAEGIGQIYGDTFVSPGSLAAAGPALGAAIPP